MKHKNFFRGLILTLMMLVSSNAFAEDYFIVDGIRYVCNDLSSSTAVRVTYFDMINQYSGDLFIPASVTYNGKTYRVTEIESQAFSFCPELTSVIIPSSVKHIRGDLFNGCDALALIEVEINNGRYDSRYGCNAIIETATNTLIAGCKNTIIPNDVMAIGNSAFSHCSALTSIDIPNSVTAIGGGAFAGCLSLTSIKIPNSATAIEDNAFVWCPALASIVVEDGNAMYDSRNGCNAIIETATNTLITGCKNTIIPNSVTTIGNSAFSNCSGLTSIEIPNSVTTIGNSAFSSCSGLTSIEIPNSVTTIKYGAFFRCSALSSIVVEDGNAMYDSRNGCNALIETATNTLITGCKNTIIPNNVTSIRDYAFADCSGLTSIEIPSSVTYICRSAFSSCYSLMDVYCMNPVPCKTDNYIFDDEVYRAATLHVPAGSLDAYRKTIRWDSFRNIVEMHAPKYEVRWIIDGEIIQTDSVEVGKPIVYSGEIPTKEGYTFSGWSHIPETMPAEDVTITGSFIANTYMVTYIVDGAVYKTVDVTYGEAIPAVEAPIKEGHTFCGWSEIPATMPAKDVTITANFTVNTYTVTYMIDGEVYKTIEVNYGEAIPTEAAPTKDGYTFSGWSYTPKTMPAEDIVISGSFILVDGIDGIVLGEDIIAVYTLDGRKVNKVLSGKIYIIEYSDGKKVKAIVKK